MPKFIKHRRSLAIATCVLGLILVTAFTGCSGTVSNWIGLNSKKEQAFQRALQMTRSEVLEKLRLPPELERYRTVNWDDDSSWDIGEVINLRQVSTSGNDGQVSNFELQSLEKMTEHLIRIDNALKEHNSSKLKCTQSQPSISLTTPGYAEFGGSLTNDRCRVINGNTIIKAACKAATSSSENISPVYTTEVACPDGTVCQEGVVGEISGAYCAAPSKSASAMNLKITKATSGELDITEYVAGDCDGQTICDFTDQPDRYNSGPEKFSGKTRNFTVEWSCGTTQKTFSYGVNGGSQGAVEDSFYEAFRLTCAGGFKL